MSMASDLLSSSAFYTLLGIFHDVENTYLRKDFEDRMTSNGAAYMTQRSERRKKTRKKFAKSFRLLSASSRAGSRSDRLQVSRSYNRPVPLQTPENATRVVHDFFVASRLANRNRDSEGWIKTRSSNILTLMKVVLAHSLWTSRKIKSASLGHP